MFELLYSTRMIGRARDRPSEPISSTRTSNKINTNNNNVAGWVLVIKDIGDENIRIKTNRVNQHSNTCLSVRGDLALIMAPSIIST
jgi:hypothetical protein